MGHGFGRGDGECEGPLGWLLPRLEGNSRAKQVLSRGLYLSHGRRILKSHGPVILAPLAESHVRI